MKVNSLPTLADGMKFEWLGYSSFIFAFLICAGLAVPVVGFNAFATARPHVDKVLTVR